MELKQFVLIAAMLSTSLVPAATLSPSCYGTSFGAQKARSHSSGEVPASDPVATPDPPLAPMGETVKHRIRIKASPLESPPPEIARIKRGYFSSFIGAFINDGLSSWFGIDLDRMEVVSIERHIYDKNATLTRPFVEPLFQWWDNRSVERKWNDKQRVEMETVLLSDLEKPDAAAFVCLANKIWEREEPRADERGFQTDTLSSSSMLIDTTVSGGKTFQSSATVLSLGPLDAVIKGINSSMPKLEYKKASKRAK